MQSSKSCRRCFVHVETLKFNRIFIALIHWTYFYKDQTLRKEQQETKQTLIFLFSAFVYHNLDGKHRMLEKRTQMRQWLPSKGVPALGALERRIIWSGVFQKSTFNWFQSHRFNLYFPKVSVCWTMRIRPPICRKVTKTKHHKKYGRASTMADNDDCAISAPMDTELRAAQRLMGKTVPWLIEDSWQPESLIQRSKQAAEFEENFFRPTRRPQKTFTWCKCDSFQPVSTPECLLIFQQFSAVCRVDKAAHYSKCISFYRHRFAAECFSAENKIIIIWKHLLREQQHLHQYSMSASGQPSPIITMISL